ncbi:MAG: glycine C-acetyltransferase [Candidatus Anammoxibacter sp.]
MITDAAKSYWRQTLEQIENEGLFKAERVMTTPQQATIGVASNARVLNMCSNNYLGLANHPEIVKAAVAGLDKWGFGLSSVRLICGTQEIHKTLEQKISEFLGTDDTILYGSCFDANCGLFETLLSDEDAVISDEFNHASIIDGIRLCKAKRLRFKNRDMADLETKLKEAVNCRFRLIATDGVFSMDGTIAKLDVICNLADKYNAMVMVDDSHAVGILGKHGKGTHEYCNVAGRVDIITGTLGKALGGAGGGYTSGRKDIIELLRQRSRPYLFSNTLAPNAVCASIKAIDMVMSSSVLRDKLNENTKYFRESLIKTGFTINEGCHPIVPIVLGDALLTQRVAMKLFKEGIYVVGFFYPVVPKGKARIRLQISAAHSLEDIDFTVNKLVAIKADFIVYSDM